MTFPVALQYVFEENKRVTRSAWPNRAIYLHLDNQQRLCTTWDSTAGKVDGLSHPWVMSESDYFADDWEVVE